MACLSAILMHMVLKKTIMSGYPRNTLRPSMFLPKYSSGSIWVRLSAVGPLGGFNCYGFTDSIDSRQEPGPGGWRHKFHVMKLLLTVASETVARLTSVHSDRSSRPTLRRSDSSPCRQRRL